MAQQNYTVKAGDTASAIASRYGTDLANISGYKSGDVNKIGVGEILSINTPDLPPVNKINATDLGSKPYAVPPKVSNTSNVTLQSLAESSRQRIESMTPTVDKGAEEIKTVYDSLSGKNVERVNMYESDGVNSAKKELLDIQNTMRTNEKVYRDRIEKIRNENPTGQMAEGQTIAIDKLEKEFTSKQADYALIAEAKQGNYTTAKSIVDAKIDAETADLTNRLSGLQFFYQQNYNRLSDERKTLLQNEMNIVQQDINDKKDLMTKLGAVALEVAKNNGTAQDVAKVFNSGSYEDAVISATPIIGQSGGGMFSNTQLAGGAANAGVALSAFNGFDADAKNFFINGDISGAKKSIDTAFTDEGASIDEVTKSIKEMKLPAQGEQYLIQYAQQAAEKNKPMTPEETTKTLSTTLTSLQTSGYSRDEAVEAVKNQLTDNGKTKLPDALQKSIDDALVQVYGRTFWQKVIPLGR